MNLNRLAILGVDVWRENKKSPAMENWSLLADSKLPSSLLLYRPDGLVISSHQVRTTQVSLPSFWEKKVGRRLITAPSDLTDEYRYWTCLIELDPDSLTELLKTSCETGPARWAQLITELLSTVFPGADPPRIPTSDSFCTFSYILYLEPDVALVDPVIDNISLVRECVRDMLTFLSIAPESACIPHLMLDFILLPGIGGLHFEDEVTVFTLKPTAAQSDLDNVSMPRSAFQLAEYLASIRVYQDLFSRLEALPFFSSDISTYYAKLETGSDPISSYGKRFLGDRLTVNSECLGVSQLARALSMQLKSNYVVRADSIRGSWPVEGLTQHPLRYNLFDHIRDSLSESQLRVDRTRDILQQRETALSDYLRDVAVYESTRVNLLLQKSIRRLTLLAVIVAFLSLMIALVPNELKDLLQALFRAVLR